MRDAARRPLRVAHIITRLIIGGAQENTLLTIEDQHQLHGDDVTLITGPAHGPEGSLLTRASAGGFRLELVPELIRSIHPLQDFRAARALKRLLRQLQPDIVHTHSSKAGILGRAVAASLGIPAVHTVHGASFHYGQRKLAYATYVQLERWAARRTAHFISVADDMTQEYVRAGVADVSRFTTVYSGFEVEPFLHPPRSRAEIRREFQIPDDAIVIGKVGRLFHLKGHEFLIAAAERVCREDQRVRFLFVGDGVLRQEYERRIAALGLTERFHFTGLVSPDRIPELMGATDIVAHTSQWEGLARVLPQALIAGKPVISYDVGGAREVVQDGETGRLLPRDVVEPLAEAILELAADPEKRRLWGETGRSRCEERFDHRFMTERIREVYARVLRRDSSTSESAGDLSLDCR